MKRWTGWIRGFAICGLVCSSGWGAGAAQGTPYKAPNGTFDVMVPAGWTADWDEQASQLTLRRGSLQAIVGGLSLPAKGPGYAKEFLEANHAELAGSCKGSEDKQDKQRGPVRLAGMEAVSFLIVCPNAPPSVAGAAVARTGDGVLVWFIEISQVRSYADDVAALDAIGATVHVVGTPALPAQALSDDDRADQMKRACVVGAFASSAECAARIAMAYTKAQPASSLPRFEDADNTFSVAVPAGWKATREDKNGIRGVQLRHGADWMALMQAPAGAQTAKDVVLRFEQGFVKPGEPQPPFSAVGVMQIFGSGVELDYDSFESENDDGTKVDSKVMAIGDISGKGPWVLMFTSIAKGTDTVSLNVAQSVHVER